MVARQSSSSARFEGEGLRVTHPERVVFHSPVITKLEVVRHYQSVAHAMLPHLRRRPLAIVRCPEGVRNECFFQKKVTIRLPAGARRVAVQTNAGVDTYAAVEKIEAIAGLAQYGTIEFHTWGSVAPRIEFADRVTVDLDPDPDVPWERVIEAARLTSALMFEFGLTGYAKTTGGKGLHVVAPIKPTRDWETIKAFARAIAAKMEAIAPDRYTAKASKASRSGRIFIDYLRNARGATAIAAYSLRARPGAPVAMPVRLDDLTTAIDVRAGHYNLRNAAEWLEPSQAAWSGYENTRATLAVASLRKLGIAPHAA